MQRSVPWDGLDDVSLGGDVTYGPLAHSCAAQTEDVAGRVEVRWVKLFT